LGISNSQSGILILQAIKQYRAFESRLVAGCNALVLIGKVQERLPDSAPFLLGQFGKFPNNLGGTHGGNLAAD
jgi:hypothetical protein